MNPYAPPKASLEAVVPGAVWRDGKLVRMDRQGALPDRCVVCNEHASKRIARTLYWSPTAWRIFCWVAPVALLVAGSTLRIPMLLLDLGACERHRRLRTVLQVLSVATLVGVILVFSRLWTGASSMTFLLLVIVCAVVLAFAQRMSGVQKISLSRLDPDHAWLAGTGKAFRAALPELRG